MYRPFTVGKAYNLTTVAPASSQSKLLSISPDDDYYIWGLFLNVSFYNNCNKIRVQTQISKASSIVLLVSGVTATLPTDIGQPSNIWFDDYFESDGASDKVHSVACNFLLPFTLDKQEILYVHSYGKADSVPSTVTINTRCTVYGVPVKKYKRI